MSLATNRSATATHVDFRADEEAKLHVWADRFGLSASIKPYSGEHPSGLIFVGYGESVAHWTIFRVDGHLWLCSAGDRTEQGGEGSKIAVKAFEDALARTIADTEA